MITLYSFTRAWGVVDPSPFCTKLECWLRMAGLEYENKWGAANMKNAPKHKLPYIDIDGQRIADSQLVIEYLVQKFGDKVDAHLNADQRAMALLLQRTLDEHCYFGLLYARWIDETNWPSLRRSFFGKMPVLMRSFIANKVRRKFKADLLGQGIARHSQADIYAMTCADLQAAMHMLGDKPFVFGEMPSSADAVLFAYVSNVIKPPFPSPMKTLLQNDARALAYCERMQSRYFPELK